LAGLENKINYFKSKPESEIRREMKEVIKYVFNPELK